MAQKYEKPLRVERNFLNKFGCVAFYPYSLQEEVDLFGSWTEKHSKGSKPMPARKRPGSSVRTTLLRMFYEDMGIGGEDNRRTEHSFSKKQ